MHSMPRHISRLRVPRARQLKTSNSTADRSPPRRLGVYKGTSQPLIGLGTKDPTPHCLQTPNTSVRQGAECT